MTHNEPIDPYLQCIDEMKRVRVVMYDKAKNMMIFLEPGEYESETKYYVLDKSTGINTEKGQMEMDVPMSVDYFKEMGYELVS